jgi:hypothetical protein
VTLIQVRRATYHGYLLEEVVGSLDAPVVVDLAIFTAGWESRSTAMAQQNLVHSRHTLILRFSDDELDCDPFSEVDLTLCGTIRRIELPSHYDIQGSVSRFIELLKEQIQTERPVSVFIDITSLPKAMLQWVFMELIRTRIMPEVFVGYVSGIYATSGVGPIFDQGVKEYFTIPHSLGDGGASVRRGCIAALGIDEKLISHYFESEAGFDRYALLASVDEFDESLRAIVQRQIEILSTKYNLRSQEIVRARPSSFIETLGALETVISYNAPIDSWELFCSGPKTFAAAGCLLSLKHRNVRLVGRIPREYRRENVVDAGVISLLRVVDLTNPAVSQLRALRLPMGSERYAKRGA